jgi:hypothetical protein
MSRQDRNKDPRLKTLLDKAKHQALEDGFEKEALEGFAMLESEQEAFDLKAALDRRMQDEVLEEKKNASPLYWVAAAGMLLVVGFSAYFLLVNDPAKKDRNNELVITEFKAPPTEAEKKQEPAPASPQLPQLSYNQEKSATQATGPNRVIQKNQGSLKNSAALNDSINLTDAVASGAVASNHDVYAPVTTKDEGLNLEKEAKGDKALAKSETFGLVREEQKQPAPEQEEKREPAKTRAKKTEEPKMAASQAYDRNSPAAGTVYSPTDDKTVSGNCYYQGGDSLLQKELTERLISKDLDKHFKVTAFINALGRISKVEFIEKNKLSTEQQNEITYVIQSLDKFRFHQRPAKDEQCSYKISR